MSSTPQESGGVQAPQKHGNMPVSILFCPECSNMLYPKEDKEARRLMYQCRTCQHTEPASSNCVYRNILKSQAGDTAGVTQDVALDPTVGGPSPDTRYFPPPSPSSALAMCGCCGQIIMCSDCEIRPAFVPAGELGAAAADNDDDDGGNWPPSNPPRSYQVELAAPMLASADAQDAWSRILEEVASLNIAPADAGADLELYDDDDDMDDWEPELQGHPLSQDLHGSQGEVASA